MPPKSNAQPVAFESSRVLVGGGHDLPREGLADRDQGARCWRAGAARYIHHLPTAGPGAELVHPIGSSEAGRDLIVARVLLAAGDAEARGLMPQTSVSRRSSSSMYPRN